MSASEAEIKMVLIVVSSRAIACAALGFIVHIIYMLEPTEC